MDHSHIMDSGGQAAWPSFSIIVTGYNEEHCIEHAVKSVLAQEYEGSIEIILSDDCSSDHTFAIMRRLAEEYDGPHRIILNREEQNAGRGLHLAHAIAKASHDWIMRQDADDYSYPYRCRQFGKAIRNHPDAIMVKSRYTIVEEEPGKTFEFPACPPEQELEPICSLSDRCPSEDAWYGHTMVVRRDFFRMIEEYPITRSFEDDLHALYAWLHGRVYDLDCAPYYYKLHAANVSTVSAAIRFDSLKSAWFYERKIADMYRALKEAKWVGLQFCSNLPDAVKNAGVRTREEVEWEMVCRQKQINDIEQKAAWWTLPVRERWRACHAGMFGKLESLPFPLYAACMVAFFKIRAFKRNLCRLRRRRCRC